MFIFNTGVLLVIFQSANLGWVRVASSIKVRNQPKLRRVVIFKTLEETYKCTCTSRCHKFAPMWTCYEATYYF